MKQRPLLVLSAVRRSERRRPPAMSRRPAMVPCCANVGCKHGRVRRGSFQLPCHTAWQGKRCVVRSRRLWRTGFNPPSKGCWPLDAQHKPSSSQSPAGRPRAGPRSRSGHPVWTRPAACHQAATPAPARRAAGRGRGAEAPEGGCTGTKGEGTCIDSFAITSTSWACTWIQ